MRVTVKGQVTIPQSLREKYGITANSEIDFIEEKGRIYIIKKTGNKKKSNRFRKFRNIATVKMTTDEIIALTRDKK